MLLLVRLVGIGALLAFLALAMTTLAFVLPGNLQILPPELDATSARFEDGRVYLDTTLGIGNNGYHDITDLVILVQAEVGGLQISDYRTPPVTAAVGQQTFIDVSVPLDLAPLVTSGDLIFRPANLTFTLGVAGTTTRSFIDFGASISFAQLVDPIVSQASLDLQNGTLALNGTAFDWTVPYTLETASFLQGNTTAQITLLNDTGGLVSEATEVVPLGRLVNENVTFAVSAATGGDLATRPQNLTVRLALILPGGFAVSTEAVVFWDPGGP
ncbi:MAG: hypothetical protein R3291_02750 [Thermoplasmata archaeon]|nr:hypothetical protein [Thermoplasmata archaeon]